MSTRTGRALTALTLGLLVGCSGGEANGPEGTGTLRVPLAATSYVGKSYVLCQGVFDIYGYNNGLTYSIDAAEHETEAFVTQSLPSGDYEVSLSGWQLCEATTEGMIPVDAQLWSSNYQYVNISPLQASYVYFSFMVAGEQLAFDGQLVIRIEVWQGSGTGGYYPYGGFAGSGPSTGGMTSVGGAMGL